MNETTIQSLIDRLCGAFVPERAVGVNETVQVELTGSQSGAWVVTLQDQTCRVEPGTIENPSLRFSAASEDALNVIAGKLDPMIAFTQGKVRMEGDLGLVMRLSRLFDIQRM